ncbi:MAG: PAS domain S-box protein, partial [Methanomicrobiales archaeon]
MTDAIRVLYVDDEPDLLEIGRIFLEGSGDFAVTTAMGGPEAIRLLEHERFDAIISDYQMPGMDGIQLLVEVRTRIGSIPFILFTGKGREEVVIQAINSGADFYLQKGGDPSAQFAELVHKVKSAASSKRAEMELCEIEERLESYINNSPDGVFIADETGCYLEVNPAACRITGYEKEELLAMHIPDLLPPESREAGAKHFKEVIEYGHGCGEMLFRHKDGSLRSWSVDAVRLSPTRFIGFVKDITGRKQAEEALRQSELLFREVFNNANDAVFLLERTPDGPGRYLLVNDKAVRMLGYSKEDLLEMSPRDIVPEDIARKVMPDVIKKLQENGHATFESAHRRKDGSTYPIEVSTHTFRYRGKDVDLSIVRDITERKQAEEALKESEEILREIIEKNPLSIQIVDKDGFTLKVNHAHTLLFGSVPPSDFSIFADLVNKQAALEKLILRVKSGEVVNLPDIYFNAHDSYPEYPDVPVWVRAIIFPLKDKSGKPERFVFIHENITERKRAEEKLLVNEQKYRDIFENSVIGLFQTAPGGRMINVNNAFAHMYGFSDAAEMLTADLEVGSPPYANPEDQQEVLRILMQIGKVENYETLHCKRDGTRFWVSITARTIRDNEGDVLLYEGTIIDITRRKRAEEALKESEKKFKTLFESANDALFMMDSTVFLDCNHSTLAVFSCSKEQIIGHPPAEFSPERQPDGRLSREKAKEKIDATLSGEPQFFEWVYLHHDRTPFDAEVTLNRVLLGNTWNIQATVRDISARKLAEQALAKSEERYRNVVEDQTEFICRFLPDGTHIFVNDAYCRYFDKKREELIGQRFRPVLHPEDREIVVRHFTSITPEHPVMDIDQRIIMPDSSIRWQRWSDRAIFDSNGKVIEYQSVGRDITAQKELENEMKYHEQELMEFSTSLATANRKLNLLSSITR